ncbi:MAG TPA: tetratricopeptide repeat protein [Rhizomicrobium sp.]|jgi:predicted Zn-dependent protease
MKRQAVWAGVIIVALGWSPQIFAQGSGVAVGQNPAGNSSLGGGNAGSGHFGDYATALRLMHSGQYEDALPYLNSALSDRPRSANLLDKLGYAQRMAGDLPDALANLQKALVIDPDHRGAHQHLGELYLAMHEPTSADAQMAELNRLCPDGCDEKDALTKAISEYRAGTATQPAH